MDLPLIFCSTLLKKLKLKTFINHINFFAHITTEGIISLNKKCEIFVDQSLTRYEINQINKNFKDFVKVLNFNKNIVNEKIKIDVNKFTDANHFMGTTTPFLDSKDNGFLKGKLANYDNIYTIGTSNIWFKTCINPTLLTLAFAMVTVKDINEKFKN